MCSKEAKLCVFHVTRLVKMIFKVEDYFLVLIYEYNSYPFIFAGPIKWDVGSRRFSKQKLLPLNRSNVVLIN